MARCIRRDDSCSSMHEPVDDLCLHNILLSCVHERFRKHMHGMAVLIRVATMANKKGRSWTMSIDLKRTEASFSPSLVVSLCHSDA